MGCGASTASPSTSYEPIEAKAPDPALAEPTPEVPPAIEAAEEEEEGEEEMATRVSTVGELGLSASHGRGYNSRTGAVPERSSTSPRGV